MKTKLSAILPELVTAWERMTEKQDRARRRAIMAEVAARVARQPRFLLPPTSSALPRGGMTEEEAVAHRALRTQGIDLQRRLSLGELASGILTDGRPIYVNPPEVFGQPERPIVAPSRTALDRVSSVAPPPPKKPAAPRRDARPKSKK